MLIALTSGQKTGLAVMAAVFVIFALLASFVIPRWWPDFPGRYLGSFLAVSALMMLGMMTAVVLFAKEDEAAHGAEPTHIETREGVETTTPVTTTAPEPGTTGREPTLVGDPVKGEQLYASAGCGSCHALQSAGSTGAVGPDLDESKPSGDLVVDRVTNGRGAMPSFRGQLSEQEILDVAAYVVNATQG